MKGTQVISPVGGWEEWVTLERKLRVFFGITTSAVVRAAKTEKLEKVQKYL